MARAFSEDSRVKIPALLHFTRLGYQYRRLKDIRAQLDFETNIDRQVLRDAMNKLNPSLLANPKRDRGNAFHWGGSVSSSWNESSCARP